MFASRWSSIRSSRDIIAADYYIGPDWNEQTARIDGNINRANNFINNKDNKGSYITITCQDVKKYCDQAPVEGGKKIGGYAWNKSGWFYYYGYIHMCDSYYTLSDINEKQDEINTYRRRGEIEKLQDMRYYKTYGQFLMHEMMHLRTTWHPEPEIIDAVITFLGGAPRRAYDAKLVHKLAIGLRFNKAGSGAQFSTLNADSYVMLINCLFWWESTTYFPGVPGTANPELADVVMPSISLGNTTDLSINSVYDRLGEVIGSYLISDSDIQDASVPAQDQNNCHGINGDYWVMSRDVAISNVQDFCHQADHTKTYNSGSVNELQLLGSNLNDASKRPQDDPYCVERFTNAVIDGCDGADPINNPFNYKFGSTLTTTDGWQYQMVPLSKQVNQVSCDVSYKFFFDGFEIRGKNLPDAKLGVHGEGLRDQLTGCGTLTNWQFERTPDDCCFQWYAAGRLPIGTKNCVGDALLTTGGSSNGNCHGPGKRRTMLGGDGDIHNWPGYGAEGRHKFKSMGRNLTAAS